MSPVDAQDRVSVWNSFLLMSRIRAEGLFRISRAGAPEPTKERDPIGGTLTNDQMEVAHELLLVAVMIEARANHLIDECVERFGLNAKAAEGAKRLNTEQKWLLLPQLAGRQSRIDPEKRPHNAVLWIFNYRNVLVHAKFEGFRSLPAPSDVISHYSDVIRAIDAMNAIVREDPPKTQGLLRFADFE